MIVSAWQGGTYGIRVGRENARKYFPKTLKKILVDIDNKFYEFSLTSTFWTTCPEFRGGPIPEWLNTQGLLGWTKGTPPQFKLTVLGDNRFKLEKLESGQSNSSRSQLIIIND